VDVMRSTEYYSQIAKQYEADVVEGPFWSIYHERRFETFNSLVPSPSKRILDFGCGSGDNLVKLTQLGHCVFGIDPVPEMIELAETKVAINGIDPSVVRVGDLTSLTSYKTAEFDIVSALNVLPYLSKEEEAEFYAQAKRLIPKDGVILVSHTNELVDLMTFNRYTVEFWRDRIIPNVTDDVEEGQELLEVLASHLSNPEKPPENASHTSERDKIKKRRVNPIDYPQVLLDNFNLVVDDLAFTHFYPMPPQFMELSPEHRDKVYAFEDRMKNDPLRYIFASLIIMRLRKAN